MAHDHEHSADHTYMHAHGLSHSHGHVHENQKAVLNRLARAIGHLETMEELVAIYTQDGDEANIRKYQNKIRIIRSAAEEDQRMLRAEILEEDKKLQEKAPEEQKPEHIEKIKKS